MKIFFSHSKMFISLSGVVAAKLNVHLYLIFLIFFSLSSCHSNCVPPLRVRMTQTADFIVTCHSTSLSSLLPSTLPPSLFHLPLLPLLSSCLIYLCCGIWLS